MIVGFLWSHIFYDRTVIMIVKNMIFRGRNRAYNKSYWKAIKNGEIISYGQHLDDLMKIDGKWYLNKRIIIHIWAKK